MSRDLEQLDKDLGAIEALLEEAPDIDKPEMSFPIAEKALNSLQWQAVSVASGSGIADRGGRPFWLRDLSNTTDSARLTVSVTTKTAEAGIMGFFFQMKKDVTIPLPPVTSTTTYHIGLEFDPTRLKDPLGPIRRVVHKNTVPYTGGRVYLPLWEVTRRPNQLLSDATVVQKRPKLSPQIHVDYPESRPDPRTQLWGATCYIRYGSEKGTTYIATGESEETGGPTRWEELTTKSIASKGSTDTYRWHSAFIERDGKRRRAYGRVFRTNGRPFGRTSNGWRVWFFEQQDRPRSNFYFAGVVAGSWKTSPAFAKVTFEPDALVLWPDANESNYFDFNGMEWWVD